VRVHTQKSADFAIAHLRARAFELTHSVKQTTMKPTPIWQHARQRNDWASTNVIPVGIYCLLCFWLKLIVRKSVRSFSHVKYKASINAFYVNMYATPRNDINPFRRDGYWFCAHYNIRTQNRLQRYKKVCNNQNYFGKKAYKSLFCKQNEKK